MLGVLIAGKSKPGQVTKSRTDLPSVKGFDVGPPVVCLSLDARQPLTAVLECSAYLSALNTASFHGGDDFAGSARQRTASSAPQPADPRPRHSGPRIPAADRRQLAGGH